MTTSVLVREIIAAQPDIKHERLATQQERLARLDPNERFFVAEPMPEVFEPSDEFVESQMRINKSRPEQVFDPTETSALDLSMQRIAEAYEQEEIQAKITRRRRRIGTLAFFAATFGAAAIAAGTFFEVRGH